MRYGNALSSVHLCLAAACFRDMPDITYQTQDWSGIQNLTSSEKVKMMKSKEVPMKMEKRRPREEDLEVVMFNQTWGSTALGYGGMGGAAMTEAYTVIIRDIRGYNCVYFGYDELAYLINIRHISEEGRNNFIQDIKDHNMAERRIAGSRYK